VGFSSTLGVAINLVRLNSVEYDPTTSTVAIGPGQTWDQVYKKLEPYGVNVAGGRIVGVGITGFVLGGGRFSVLYLSLI
jgi:FAD/FMN-containing dehydrogenase